jgi:hypothetical protein
MKKCVVLSLLVVAVCSLNSCAMFTNNAVQKACANAPYVYSDLQSDNDKTAYHLPAGKPCPVENKGFWS